MGYAYELNICKFDLKLYKLVGVNFMTISHVLIIFFESIQNLLSFCILFNKVFKLATFYYKKRLGPKFKKCGNEHICFAVVKTKQVTIYFLEASTRIIFFSIHLLIIRLIKQHFIFYLIYI